WATARPVRATSSTNPHHTPTGTRRPKTTTPREPPEPCAPALPVVTSLAMYSLPPSTHVTTLPTRGHAPQTGAVRIQEHYHRRPGPVRVGRAGSRAEEQTSE